MKRDIVLVLGSGGREHSIVWKLSQSEKVEKIYTLPGNAGTLEYGENVDIAVDDIENIVKFAKKKNVDMVVVGPELPLSMGVVDALEAESIRAFGPNKKCARLEASKSFTKEFLIRNDIPTAKYIEVNSPEEATENIGIFGFPMIIKADGMASGKGVIIAKDHQEAVDGIDKLMRRKEFGESGSKVVIEECLVGREASVLCFVDNNTIIPMESAQDYKRAYDGDLGENTGGMGTYSPNKVFTDELNREIKEKILDRTIEGFKREGLDFKGVLFVGIMLTEDGPKVIEFNNRFGDPESQSVLFRLESDLYDIFEKTCDNRLSEVDLKWSDEHSICVIIASGGYPGSYKKGYEILGLDKLSTDVKVFHSGTKKLDGKLLSSGGRVLGVTVKGKNLEEIRNRVYDEIKKIEFQDSFYRSDIGN